MNKDVLLKFGDAVYEANDDGSQFIINTVLEGGNTYEFKFYGGYDNPCVEEYIYTKEINYSKSINTPFLNKTLKGRAVYTFKKGNLVYQA